MPCCDGPSGLRTYRITNMNLMAHCSNLNPFGPQANDTPSSSTFSFYLIQVRLYHMLNFSATTAMLHSIITTNTFVAKVKVMVLLAGVVHAYWIWPFKPPGSSSLLFF